MPNLFTTILEFAGTFAFAISGIKLAAGKQLDWLGAFIIGLATAIGGGTIRDLLLGLTPFWMLDGKYFLITGLALLATLVFKNKLLQWKNPLFLFDAIGLGLFTVVGITKSVAMGWPMWVCIVMGTITGSMGGVIRDVLLNEVPLLLRRDIYALASIVGGLVYFACRQFSVSISITELIAAITVTCIRIVAVKFHIHLPVLHPIEGSRQKEERNKT